MFSLWPNWKRRLCQFTLLVVPLVLFVAVIVVRWFNNPGLWELEKEARRRAGWAAIGAVDCGLSIDKQDVYPRDKIAVENTSACAEEAHRFYKPFIVRYATAGWYHLIIGTRTGAIIQCDQSDLQWPGGHYIYHYKWDDVSNFGRQLRRKLDG